MRLGRRRRPRPSPHGLLAVAACSRGVAVARPSRLVQEQSASTDPPLRSHLASCQTWPRKTDSKISMGRGVLIAADRIGWSHEQATGGGSKCSSAVEARNALPASDRISGALKDRCGLYACRKGCTNAAGKGGYTSDSRPFSTEIWEHLYTVPTHHLRADKQVVDRMRDPRVALLLKSSSLCTSSLSLRTTQATQNPSVDVHPLL